jgi:RNA polymerase sigma factor (TIGR02999 family)
MAEAGQVTELLRAYDAGDHEAFNRLVPLVYDELRAVARRQLRHRDPAQSMTVTALVNEAYLKLAAARRLHAEDRDHLLAVAACAMRQVLVGRARARLRDKRGAGERPLELDEAVVPAPEPDPDFLLDLDRSLAALREHDPSLARIFECRFFAGLGEEETAAAVGLPLRTVQRGWMRARAWVRHGMHGSDGPRRV